MQREHNKKLNHGLLILHKVPPKRDHGWYFCTLAEKAAIPPEAEKKPEQEAKSPHVLVYDFSEIMKGKKAKEWTEAPAGAQAAPKKPEKAVKQEDAPEKSEEKPKE